MYKFELVDDLPLLASVKIVGIGEMASSHIMESRFRAIVGEGLKWVLVHSDPELDLISCEKKRGTAVS